MNSEPADQKFDLLFNKFALFFRNRGHSLKDNFASDVWFLKEDETFQYFCQIFDDQNKDTKVVLTQRDPNKMIDILTTLNKSQKNPRNLKKMNVNVKEFITKVIQTLLDAKKKIQLSDQCIQSNNSNEKISMIQSALSKMEKKDKKEKGLSKMQDKDKDSTSLSTLKSWVTSMDNFPAGEYALTMITNTSFDKESVGDLNEIELANTNPLSPTSIANMFTESQLNLNNTITIPEDDIPMNLKAQVPQGNTSLNQFQNYCFSKMDIKHKHYFADRRFSGTTFANFKLKAQRKNKLKEIFQSRSEYLLNIILILNIDDLCDLKKEVLRKSLKIKMKSPVSEKECTVGIDFEFELDDTTRSGILMRYYNLLSLPVSAKMQYEDQIREMLHTYFEELAEVVSNILDQKEEKRDSCCSSCSIF